MDMYSGENMLLLILRCVLFFRRRFTPNGIILYELEQQAQLKHSSKSIWFKQPSNEKNTHTRALNNNSRGKSAKFNGTRALFFFRGQNETELKQFCAPHIISRRNRFMAVKIYHCNIRFTYLQIRKKLHSTS